MVEQNYKLYNEVATLKQSNKRQTKAVSELIEAFPQDDEKMGNCQ